MNYLFIALQYLLPHHLLSRLVGRFAEARTPSLKNRLIQLFIKQYGVDMSEAEEEDYCAYPTFNAFFTRALKPDARPVCDDENDIACPADGAISQLGDIRDGRIFQAKGRDYDLRELLGGDDRDAAPFRNGRFATIYLSPKDYHRVHMPIAGTLRRTHYIPGQLFSVNQATTEAVPRLFARNERLVCLFDTPAGPMAVILVGAMIVAGIETVWAGQVTPLPRSVQTREFDNYPETVRLDKGDELGRFKLGSTVLLLFGEDAVAWSENFAAGSQTRMGEALGTFSVTPSPAESTTPDQPERPGPG